MRRRLRTVRLARRIGAPVAIALSLGGVALAADTPDPADPSLHVTVLPSTGYWLVTADGSVLPFGDSRVLGANRNQGADIAGMARTPDGRGYWQTDTDGDVFAYGGAAGHGSRTHNADDVVGLAAHPTGSGYWLVASDGGIFAFGDAGFHGSTGAITLNRPIVGMAATPTGNGYWLVASDGGIFTFGDAGFHGSTGAITLNRPIVGMASTGTAGGYWLVASDGGIFTFGDAPFLGSGAGQGLAQPVVSIVPTPPVVVVDNRPLAADDQVTVPEDGATVVNVLGNDAGLADGGLSVTITGPPAHGTATAGSDGTIAYAPVPDYEGPDQLTYRVTDTDGDQSTATVTITVTSVDHFPLAADDTLQATEDSGSALVNVLANDAGLSDGALSVQILTPPANGTATAGTSGTIGYVPAPQYSGPDQFTYRVTDTDGDESTATVRITVASVDDLPLATADALTVSEDSGGVAVNVLGNDTGLGDGGIGVAIVTPPTHGTATVNPDGTVTYAPVPNYEGTDGFEYRVTDTDNDSDEATVNITVTSVDDTPLAVDDAQATAFQTSVRISVTANDTGLGDGLQPLVVGQLNPLTQGTAQVDGFDVIFTPADGVSGEISFSYTITDTNGDTDEALVTVTVAPPPVTP